MKSRILIVLNAVMVIAIVFFNFHIFIDNNNAIARPFLCEIIKIAHADGENEGDCTYSSKVEDTGTKSGTYKLTKDDGSVVDCEYTYDYYEVKCFGKGQGTLCCTPSLTISNCSSSCDDNFCS